MNNIVASLILGLLILSSSANAETNCHTTDAVTTDTQKKDINTSVPKGMEGAVIIVRQKDGKESIVPIEQYKVVPRKQQLVVTQETKEKSTMCTRTELIDQKNRVSALVGAGLVPGLKRDNSNSPTLVEVENRTGPVLGLQYQRKIGDNLSIGVQGQTNETGSALIGVDF